ncbi:MAG TPA: hypothetical protein VF441_04645, partial [Acidimicrobiia bacterium]
MALHHESLAGASSYVGPTPQLVRPNASKHRADNANKYRAKRPAPPVKTADLPLRYSENRASTDRRAPRAAISLFAQE